VTSRYRIGIDTGGTFTDLVLVDSTTGARRTVKVPSTPSDPAAAVLAAVDRTGIAGADIEFFVLATTIATNALLERKGARVVYVTTAGFEDIPFIQRINRPHLFDLQWTKAAPYVARRDCVGVRERIASDGSVRTALEQQEIDRLVGDLVRRDREAPIAVALNLLFSYIEPAHEQQIARAIRAALPHAPISVSHELAPIWREYERGNTAIVDAYLGPLVTRFAHELDDGIAARGVGDARFLLKSNGGQVPIRAASRRAVDLVLSGLAGGMIAGKEFASATGERRLITLDMGGTSADVGIVVDERIRNVAHTEFEWGLPVAVPVVDLTTIGAGGSSLARFDQGGLLEVGPRSAGAEPGPAAYGRGGTEATVTDANLVLGRLNPAYFLGGELPLDLERARDAVRPFAERLGVSLEEAAQAIVEVATENMANAIRLLAADRGLDYRGFRLAAFGGAGPLHASLLARRIGLAGVLVPPSPGLASAFGALAADLRADRRLTRLFRSDIATDDELRTALGQVADETVLELRREGATSPVLSLSVSCRYQGQNFEQEVVVSLETEDLVRATVERFHAAHELTYGYRIDDAVVEIVDLNGIAIERRPQLQDAAAPTGTLGEPSSTRPVYFKDEAFVETPIWRRGELPSGAVLAGPAVIEEIDSTTLVLHGEQAVVQPSGYLLIDATPARGLAYSSSEETTNG
jgi:N-methylhydantoinase A